MSRIIRILSLGVLIGLFSVGASYATDGALVQPDAAGTGFFLSADYLYLRLDENESGILEPDWDSGFSLSAGYKIPDTGWDILGRYTYYRASSDYVVTGYFTTATMTGIISARNDYDLDEAVIEAGDNFVVTDGFDLRLHLGAQYTRIEKQATYHADYYFTIPPPAFPTYQNEFDMEFQGYGLRAGADCHYDIWRSLGLSGGISGGFLFGTIKRYHMGFPSLSDEYTEVVPFYGANLGVGYDIKISKTINLNVSTGYEVSEYFNLASTDFSYDGVNFYFIDEGNDYILHGPYARARLDF